MKTTLAERLREARKAASMTQKTLGDAVGVSQAAIQKIETGRAAQTTKLLDIAKALRVRPEWLSSGTGAMRADGEDDKKPSHINHDVFRVDILDLAVSAGPGIVNQEFVEILHSVEYAPAEARHMFDGRKAENIRIINVRG
ncbi:TPA: helix-turn-helix domain-containing protein, partial [Klebsiella pneumoniae]|nr:helix-turn-helix domain-containing protein [Klebsiella pneumoniae]HBR7395390.1 helix-turn-helix domain-containing protein [Klebsiella pneumoniae]HBX8221222.1 helix-turn-helix domain-containing protein [Klebsiella pneumoniae]